MGVFVAGFTVALSGLVAWSGIVGFAPWKRGSTHSQMSSARS